MFCVKVGIIRERGTSRYEWTNIPTLEKSLQMKASALHRLLGSRTGVKQSHSCNRRQIVASENSAHALLRESYRITHIHTRILTPTDDTGPSRDKFGTLQQAAS